MNTKTQSSSIPVVLGGGAMRGVSLLGFLDYLDEQDVNYSTLTGISIGSIVAAFKTNGYGTEETRDVFLGTSSPNIGSLLRSLLPPLNPLRWGGVIDTVPMMAEFVDKYGLKPNPQLRIVAYDVVHREPVVFEGEDYNLTLALAASCAVPIMMRPVPMWLHGKFRLLVDGGVFHPQPGVFEGKPAIIAKLIDLPFLQLLFPDRPQDHVASVADTCTPFFQRLDLEKFQELYDTGYRKAREALQRPLQRGLLPLRQGFCPA